MPTRAERVLLLVTQSDWGGVQKFLIDFAVALKAEGREVMLASGGNEELFEKATERKIPTTHLKWMMRNIHPLCDLMSLIELRMLIRSFKPDAIHVNSSKMGVLGSISAMGTGARVVYRIGGWSFLEPMSSFSKWMYRTAEYATSFLKDRILVVHPNDILVGASIGISTAKMRCAPNGLDVTAFQLQLHPRSMVREEIGIPESAFVFGTVANAYSSKALDRYLETANRVLQKDQHAHVCVVGSGPEFERLQKLRSILSEKDRIHLLGRRADATRLYAGFDVFVLPSIKEGMPWTILEAMASGVPVLATDVGACKWMIEDSAYPACGIVVPPSDALSLESAMNALRVDADRLARLGSAGVENVRARFSWTETLRINQEALDS